MPSYPHYDPHLWTIPYEYRSGMLLALALLCFARCRITVRMTFMFVTACFVGMWERWELVCFLLGSLLCEIDLITGAGAKLLQEEEMDDETKPLTLSDTFRETSYYWPCRPSPSLTSCIKSLQTPVFITSSIPTISFIIGLFLLSTPSLGMATTPGYRWIASVIPSCYTDPKRFPYTVGALLTVFGLMRSSTLRKPFLYSFPQYLGRISFALYVVHGPLIHIVGFAVTPTIWRSVTGLETSGQWLLGFLLGSMVLFACVLICADCFCRTVEAWSINIAKSVEKWCFEEV